VHAGQAPVATALGGADGLSDDNFASEHGPMVVAPGASH
jgi:hypothetical protein